jgi:chromosome segregation ATPase
MADHIPEQTDSPITPRRTRVDHAHAAVQPTEAPATVAATAGFQRASFASDDLAGLDLLELEQPTEEMLGIVAGESADARREQLQLEVTQLAGHLRERMREVDRREATLNARASELEAELRTSRLWLRERETEFQDRERELVRQVEELREQLGARPAEALPDVFEIEARRAELAEHEQTLRLKENDLRERRFDVDRQAAALRHSQQLWEQQQANEAAQAAAERETVARERQHILGEIQAAAAEREEQLRAAEKLLNEHARQLDADRTSLAADRQAWEEHRARQREAIDQLRSDGEAELADRRSRLDARQDWIERQKEGLDQVRDEALRLHRQSLEMRLLAEQLWAQIGGRLTPAEITHTIAQLKQKLAEQFRLEEDRLTARQVQLAELAERVTAQHVELNQLRDGLREWAAAREAEIEGQAASLVERELALDTQQDELRQARHAWNAERRNYEQQIRDLGSQLRSQLAAA